MTYYRSHIEFLNVLDPLVNKVLIRRNDYDCKSFGMLIQRCNSPQACICFTCTGSHIENAAIASYRPRIYSVYLIIMQLNIGRDTWYSFWNAGAGIILLNLFFVKGSQSVCHVFAIRCFVCLQSVFYDFRELNDLNVFLVAFPQAVKIIIEVLYSFYIIMVKRIKDRYGFIVVIKCVGCFIH